MNRPAAGAVAAFFLAGAPATLTPSAELAWTSEAILVKERVPR
jgi:hypothetical protein